MKRRAFIIGSPLDKNSEAYLPGVHQDVMNIYRFLISSVGGAFNDTEIYYFENPEAQQLINDIQVLAYGADIATVYYSGHGFMCNGQDYLCLNNREDINIKRLITKAKRQHLFIDACRTECEWSDFVGIGDVAGFSFDMRNLALARQLFDAYLQKAPHGGTITFSSRPNQRSMDTVMGGVFTQSLLFSLQGWHRSLGRQMLTIKQSFDLTMNELHRLGSNQSPRLYAIGNTNAIYAPLAVNADAYNVNQLLRSNFLSTVNGVYF